MKKVPSLCYLSFFLFLFYWVSDHRLYYIDLSNIFDSNFYRRKVSKVLSPPFCLPLAILKEDGMVLHILGFGWALKSDSASSMGAGSVACFFPCVLFYEQMKVYPFISIK
ncbi:uncharacterized protein BX664DRAFT_333579 [Halteromyces radiatus]|uniref:uncharacterized protein n=1 Tax=Halteromyces radiatus TaxID=101107 RepID=UPI00221FB90E|nr:uncharacterized protein BX664DRAFT_333579 [Halteromyces radiatus]KAI8089662.1 hypothetical protein BX664DRAFT_333579 [Halteromyces radiatus]